MNFKHWAIQKLLKWSKVLDIEKALRDKYHEGIETTEKKYANRVNVWYDPTVRINPHYFHVQPAQAPTPVVPNPRGRYFKAHHLEFMPPVVRTNTEPINPEKDFPAFLNSVPKAPTFVQAQAMLKRDIADVPTARDIAPDPLNTDEYPAIVSLLHQDREQRRHAG